MVFKALKILTTLNLGNTNMFRILTGDGANIRLFR